MPRILITGVSSGIGRALADLYAERGWDVIGTVRNPDARPDGLNDAVELQRLDLAVPGSGAELAARVLADGGCPDVVVNNAGVVQFGPIEDVSAEDVQRIFQINLFGQLEIVRGFAAPMRERRSGVIANVSSLGGTITFPFFGIYNSSKWALEGVSEGLWHELKPFGVRVKLIEPGYVATAIWGKALPAEGAQTAEPDLPGAPAYAPYVRSMLAFEKGITTRTSSEDAAVEIERALSDTSDRLRYPVAAYARAITRARRTVGGQALIGFFHERWMGPGSNPPR